MAHRIVLTERQRAALYDLPCEEEVFMRHYILSKEDLAHIKRRRRPENRFGFALQLCALRYPGRLLQPNEIIPEGMAGFVGLRLGFSAEDLAQYGARRSTKYEHSSALQDIYGYRSFEGKARIEFKAWLTEAAKQARTNEQLATTMVDEMRKRQIILPGISVVERMCAKAFVQADRDIEAQIIERVEPEAKRALLNLLEDTVDGRLTRFAWLKSIEPGSKAKTANALLDRLAFLSELPVDGTVLADLPAHRIAKLRRQGERYSADGLRRIGKTRRLAILATCVVEWQAMVIDAIIETHDRIVGRLYRVSERRYHASLEADRVEIEDVLQSLEGVVTTMVNAKADGKDVDTAISDHIGWDQLESLRDTARGMTRKIAADPLDYVGDGYRSFRRYAPRVLKLLNIEGAQAAAPLLEAVTALKNLNQRKDTKALPNAPIAFARPKWKNKLTPITCPDRVIWEAAILFALRDAFRSGDIWVKGSRRHQNMANLLLPPHQVATSSRLVAPLYPDQWIQSRKKTLDELLDKTTIAATQGHLPNSFIQDGELKLERLEPTVPPGADDLILKLYRQIPLTRITDILLQSDADIGFTEAFTNLRTGAPNDDRIGILNVLLAHGINLGLKKMASVTNTHTPWQLYRLSQWHVEEDAFHRALAMVVEAQHKLPMAKFWGKGRTASSDGQFFPASGQGEALNLVNLKYGHKRGLKAYTHLNDQYAPFSQQTIPATASEAPYILDGLLMSDAGLRVKEAYADTGGFTDQVFAFCALLGFSFAPRIKDLPQKRLYVFSRSSAPNPLKPMIGGKINTDLIIRNWPDILRLAASVAAGIVAPSHILKKMASYPRQHELAVALREIGRVERSIFMLRWLLDIDLQRRAHLGLNKGESHHALKRAINFHRRGEIRDRSSEGQHYRMAALNLLTAIIVYWNTKQLGDVVASQIEAGETPSPDLLQHVSPLGWEHINLTGEYLWPTDVR